MKLEVFNIAGRKVAVLVETSMAAGRHSVDWDGLDHPSGMYFNRLTADDIVETRKMILLK